LVSLFQKHNGDHEIFFTNFAVLQTKIFGTFWLENCVFTSVKSSNSPFFIKNKYFKYHKLGKKILKNPQQEGALNQGNKISKILESFPTIIQSLHKIIGNNGIFHFVCLFLL